MNKGVLRILDLHARSERHLGSTCWLWKGATAGDKVSPRIWTIDYDRIEKRAMSGPRAVWMIKHQSGLGERLGYMTCCNPSCVNPEHVSSAGSKAEIGAHHAANGKRKGTSVAQRRDNVRKAWAARGIIPTPPHLVLAAREGIGTNRAIARELGISQQVVGQIRLGNSHRHVVAI